MKKVKNNKTQINTDPIRVDQFDPLNPRSIPSDWSWVKLGDVCETTSGGTPSRGKKKYYEGNIPWIKSGELNFSTIVSTEESISKEALQNSSAKIFPKGTLLIALYGATVGRLAFLGIEAATNQAVAAIFTPQSLFNKFLYWFLFSYRDKLLKDRIGGAQPNISQGTLKNINIPLPPLPIQHKIVEKIEELFSELDSGVANLRKAKDQIKTYRQSVLAFAFSGRLTRNVKGETRTKEAGQEEKGELPVGWTVKKFVDFCKLQRGYDLPLKNIVKGKYPVITSGGINGYHSVYRAIGPCLTTGRSGSVGNILFLQVKKYWPHNTVLFVKDFCGNHPKFTYYFFKQFDFKSFSASTAVPTLDRKQLYNELVKVPPIETQHQIVSEIERQFSVADKLEQTINESLEKAEQLKQSILHKAFIGKLI